MSLVFITFEEKKRRQLKIITIIFEQSHDKETDRGGENWYVSRFHKSCKIHAKRIKEN